MAGFFIENFGCRANRADGESIAAALAAGGRVPSGCMEEAEVVVVNTCTVTEEADRQVRAFVRRVHRNNPGARIVVTGCYAQRAPEELAALPGVSSVVGNSHKALTAGRAEAQFERGPALSATPDFVPLRRLAAAASPEILVDEAFAHTALEEMAPHFSPAGQTPGARSTRTRPNLKVQEGCGNRCSFCVIPQTRGGSRSMPLDACLRSVDSFVAEGGKELVLSGINLGRWGRDLNPASSFEELVEALLRRTELPRLRLSSIEPMDWTPRLLELFREFSCGEQPRLARHAHLPLQSGADAVLRAMHRRYRPWHYAERLDRIRELMPEAAIGADVMVGFPGESRELFEESFAFLRARPFTYLHLFPFSARPGTAAWKLEQRHPVPPQEKKERMRRLQDWIGSANLEFRRRCAGRVLPAVTLHGGTPDPAGTSVRAVAAVRAMTDNFLEVRLTGAAAPNCLVRVRIASLEADALRGEIVR